MNIGKYFLEVFILIQRITNLIEHIIFLKIFFSLRRIQSLVILHNKNKKTKTKNKKQKTKNKKKQKTKNKKQKKTKQNKNVLKNFHGNSFHKLFLKILNMQHKCLLKSEEMQVFLFFKIRISSFSNMQATEISISKYEL